MRGQKNQSLSQIGSVQLPHHANNHLKHANNVIRKTGYSVEGVTSQENITFPTRLAFVTTSTIKVDKFGFIKRNQKDHNSRSTPPLQSPHHTPIPRLVTHSPNIVLSSTINSSDSSLCIEHFENDADDEMIRRFPTLETTDSIPVTMYEHKKYKENYQWAHTASSNRKFPSLGSFSDFEQISEQDCFNKEGASGSLRFLHNADAHSSVGFPDESEQHFSPLRKTESIVQQSMSNSASVLFEEDQSSFFPMESTPQLTINIPVTSKHLEINQVIPPYIEPYQLHEHFVSEHVSITDNEAISKLCNVSVKQSGKSQRVSKISSKPTANLHYAHSFNDIGINEGERCSNEEQNNNESGNNSGDSDNEVDFNLLRRHEAKWIAMLRDWPDWINNQFKKVKKRCRKGIPMSIRGNAWRHLSGAVVLEKLNPSLFERLSASKSADTHLLSEIARDLHRSFPNHEMFYSSANELSQECDTSNDFSGSLNDMDELELYSFSTLSNHCPANKNGIDVLSESKEHDKEDNFPCTDDVRARQIKRDCSSSPFKRSYGRRPRGQLDLYLVLKAFSIYNPSIGYCQALAPIASVLLMHMPARHAFWVLVSICQFYMPNYYGPGLNQLIFDSRLLQQLINSKQFMSILPDSICEWTYNNLCDTDPLLYMTEWFMCLFVRALPWTSVLRVWDMFFCEGPKVLFKVALARIHFSMQMISKSICSKNQSSFRNASKHTSTRIVAPIVTLVDSSWSSSSWNNKRLLDDDNCIIIENKNSFNEFERSDLSTIEPTQSQPINMNKKLQNNYHNEKVSITNNEQSTSRISESQGTVTSAIEDQGEILNYIKHVPNCLLRPATLFNELSKIKLTDKQLFNASVKLQRTNANDIG